jgi:hypothetical protein
VRPLPACGLPPLPASAYALGASADRRGERERRRIKFRGTEIIAFSSFVLPKSSCRPCEGDGQPRGQHIAGGWNREPAGCGLISMVDRRNNNLTPKRDIRAESALSTQPPTAIQPPRYDASGAANCATAPDRLAPLAVRSRLSPHAAALVAGTSPAAGKQKPGGRSVRRGAIHRVSFRQLCDLGRGQKNILCVAQRMKMRGRACTPSPNYRVCLPAPEMPASIALAHETSGSGKGDRSRSHCV